MRFLKAATRRVIAISQFTPDSAPGKSNTILYTKDPSVNGVVYPPKEGPTQRAADPSVAQLFGTAPTKYAWIGVDRSSPAGTA